MKAIATVVQFIKGSALLYSHLHVYSAVRGICISALRFLEFDDHNRELIPTPEYNSPLCAILIDKESVLIRLFCISICAESLTVQPDPADPPAGRPVITGDYPPIIAPPRAHTAFVWARHVVTIIFKVAIIHVLYATF